MYICMYVRTDVPRTDDFLRTKISWMHRSPNFLTHGGPLRVLRARESSANNFLEEQFLRAANISRINALQTKPK